MSFWSLQFLPKTNKNKSTWRYHSSKVEFIHSFFGRIHGLAICFRVLLTFKGSFFQKVLMHLSYEQIIFLNLKFFILVVFKAALACQGQPSCPYKPLSYQILKHSIFLSRFQSLFKSRKIIWLCLEICMTNSSVLSEKS